MADPLRALIEGVAQATAELIAEQYDSPAEIWAEREQIARAIADATEAEAQEDPEAPYRIVRKVVSCVPHIAAAHGIETVH